MKNENKIIRIIEVLDYYIQEKKRNVETARALGMAESFRSESYECRGLEKALEAVKRIGK